MKIVIDIDENLYTRLFDNGMQDNEIAVDDVCEMARAIRLGTPLPSQRYKPIILQEHDAEPRTLRAILDTETEEIYVCKLTKQGAEILGMTIEEVRANES